MQLPPVSVVVCARNEAANLSAHLAGLCTQDYPEYEVMVVNDASSDETNDLLHEFMKKYPQLTTVDVVNGKNKLKGKKNALTTGIDRAKYDLILVTDSDCKPAGNYWISSMVEELSNGTEIVLGYSPYTKEGSGSWLNMFIRYDTFITATQYLSLAISGHPYMGVGRNMIYKKSLFQSVDPYKNKENLLSGDDDLFINKASKSENTRIELDKSSFMYSVPKGYWSEFFTQKKRHITTGSHYNTKSKFILGSLFISHVIFYLSFFTLLIGGYSFWWLLAIFGLRLTIQYVIFSSLMNKLSVKDLLILTPVLDFFYVLFYIILATSNIFNKRTEWILSQIFL